jgi:hypothetical protein
MKRLILITAIATLCLAAFAWVATSEAQSGNMWHIDFYPNSDWAGSPTYSQVTPFLNFNWGSNPPGPNMPSSNWTARATSDAFFYAGTYRFTVLADDEVALTIDNVTYLNTIGQGQSGKTQVIDIPMTQATHRVQVDFRQFTGGAYLSVNWVYLKPGGGGQPPPPQPTPTPSGPTSATSVQTRYGDYTPCIQQNLHQKECFQSDGAWNSPNMGSIETEPKIQIWGNCKADSVSTFVIDPNTDPPTTKDYKCSKTDAGWFPN